MEFYRRNFLFALCAGSAVFCMGEVAAAQEKESCEPLEVKLPLVEEPFLIDPGLLGKKGEVTVGFIAAFDTDFNRFLVLEEGRADYSRDPDFAYFKRQIKIRMADMLASYGSVEQEKLTDALAQSVVREKAGARRSLFEGLMAFYEKDHAANNGEVLRLTHLVVTKAESARQEDWEPVMRHIYSHYDAQPRHIPEVARIIKGAHEAARRVVLAEKPEAAPRP